MLDAAGLSALMDEELSCYVSFSGPEDEDAVIGVGLEVSTHGRSRDLRDATSPCEALSAEAFFELGVRERYVNRLFIGVIRLLGVRERYEGRARDEGCEDGGAWCALCVCCVCCVCRVCVCCVLRRGGHSPYTLHEVTAP